MNDTTITDVEVTGVSCPMDVNVSGSSYDKEERSTVVVTVRTDAGVTGRSYSGDFGDIGADKLGEVLSFIEDHLAPMVVGERLFSIEALWEETFSRSKKYLSFQPRERFLYVHAVGTVDTALWDAIGKSLDAPLYEVWGAYQDSVPIISTGGYYEAEKSLSALGDEAKELEDIGFCGMKMKVGSERIDSDIDRLRAVKEKVSDEFLIGCDANQGYSVADAITFAEKASEVGIRWVEEPVAWYDQYQGMREVRNKTNVPVTAGQSELSPSGCKQLIESESVDIINYDASWGGGPTPWHKIASLADVNNIEMVHHEEPHLAMHLLASVPNALFIEGFHPDLDPIFFEMVENTPTIEGGEIHLPDAAGLGIEIDDSFVDAHAVDR